MRRNFLRSFLAAAIISVFFSATAYAESAVVIGNGVNFRAGPGMNYYVIATLDGGTSVEVTDRSNGSWYAVSCGGYNGFISSAYLSIQENTLSIVPDFTYPAPSVSYTQPTYSSSSPVSSTTEAGYINAMYVRFRSGPSSSYSVLGTYSTGKAVSILGEADGWTACVIDGQLGYVYSQYVSKGTASSGIYVPSGNTSTGSSGITIVPDKGTSTLPQPDQSGVTVVNPVVTPAPAYPPVAAVTPAPTYSPIVVVTPAPTFTLPSPSVTTAPVTTPTVSTGNRANLSAYIAGSYVRFRSGPGTNYNILGTYNTGKAIRVHDRTSNGWLLCTIDGVDGYVFENYVLIVNQGSYGSSSPSGTNSSQQIGGSSQGGSSIVVQPVVTPTPTPNITLSKSAYITGNNVRFRSAPSMNSNVLDELFYGNAVTLHAVSDGWALVTYNGQVGYVYAQYVKEGSYNTSPPTQSGTGSNGSVTGQNIVNFALQYVGYNYCWGGSDPSTGFDCSGLVYYVYKQFGYTLNRVAQDQASNGVHVDPSAIQPGDILCFYSGSSYIGHVGIYIGDGKFVHASNSTTGVIISELSGYYSTRGYEARRIV